MGRTVIILNACVLLIFATFPNFGKSTNLTVGEEFKFSCKHDGRSEYWIYPFSQAESFNYYTMYPVMNIKIRAQSFDNGNKIKCTTKDEDGKKLLNTTDVLVVRPSASVKEFDPDVVQEYVFYDMEEFDFTCDSTLVGWIKVDANNVVTNGGTKNGLITKKFNLTSDQFDGAKLICLQFQCSRSVGCERRIQKVVIFRRKSTELTVGEEFNFSCKHDGRSVYWVYPFSQAESFNYYTMYPVMNIKIRAQSFDNGNKIKCTTKDEDGKKLLNTTDVLVVRPSASVNEFDPDVVQEYVFYDMEEFDFTCDSTLVGWIKVDANNVVTNGGTKNGLITKKFTLTSDQFDGAKLICLLFQCSRSVGCERRIQKVVTLRWYGRTTTSSAPPITIIPTSTTTTFWTTNPPAANTTLWPTTTNPPATITTLWPTTTYPPATDTTLWPTTTSPPARMTTTSAPADPPTTEKPLPTTDEPREHFKFQGPVGPPGPTGAVGPRGAPGVPGLPGVCPVTCPVINFYRDEEIYPEGVEPELGTEKHPAPVACRFIPATQQGPAPDPYWVMEDEKFPVECDRTTNRTCLLLSHDDATWIKETKLLVGSQARTWLSRSGFNLDRFNTITQNQLYWLKEQSENVEQTIRVYLTNITFAGINLRMLSATDVVVGMDQSHATPMYYTVQQQEDNVITVDGEAWNYVDLVIIDNAKRLPVVDFHVELRGQVSAYFSVQLRQLCFG